MVWLLNSLLPGTGLILRRREWLGLSLAMVFAICGNVALTGVLIAPRAIPAWLTVLAIVTGGLTWLLAQWLCYRRGLVLARRQRAIANLLKESEAAMASGDLASARRALEGGLALDDENVQLHVMRAGLAAMDGDHSTEKAAWRRVKRLDPSHKHQVAGNLSSAGQPPTEGGAMPG